MVVNEGEAAPVGVINPEILLLDVSVRRRRRKGEDARDGCTL